MEEVIKEVEKEKTDGFIEEKKPKTFDWDELEKKMKSMKPGEIIIIPGGTYTKKDK